MSLVAENGGSDSRGEGATSNKEIIDKNGLSSDIWKWFGFLKSDRAEQCSVQIVS